MVQAILRFYARPISWIIFILLRFTTLPAQGPSGCDLQFIQHLMNRGEYREAIYLLDSGECKQLGSTDSVNYLRGWSLYSLEKLTASAACLIKVSPASPFYMKSRFFSAYDFTHLGNYQEARSVLDSTVIQNPRSVSLKNFQLAGLDLLQKNFAGFNDWLAKTDTSQFELNEYAGKLDKLSLDMQSHKAKSPAIAGLMSAIVPGSGKFYAGSKGGAVSAFLSNLGLGLVAWENGRKSGYTSFRTIAFGTAFLAVYTANIYGAVVSVRILENEYHENVKNTILFNLHIPLRNSFDR